MSLLIIGPTQTDELGLYTNDYTEIRRINKNGEHAGFAAFAPNPDRFLVTELNNADGTPNTIDNAIGVYAANGNFVGSYGLGGNHTNIRGIAVFGTTVFIAHHSTLTATETRIAGGSIQNFNSSLNIAIHTITHTTTEYQNMYGLEVTNTHIYRIDRTHGQVLSWFNVGSNAGQRDIVSDINLDDANTTPFDLTIDGSVMLVSDADTGRIFAYDIS